MDNIRNSEERVNECLKDFLVWLIEYCKEKNPELLKDIGFVGHLERTKAAVETHLELLEGKSPELHHSKDIFKVPMTHQNLF